MYDKTSLGILEKVYLKPGIHKRELSKQLRLGMPSIDYSLNKIGKLLKRRKSGNQINYFLDYSKEALAPALCCVEYSRFERLPAGVKMAVREFLKDLEEKPAMAALFGSYARGDYARDSDIDILLVFQKSGDGKQIESAAKKVSMRTGTAINPVYLDYGAFRESFHNPTKEFFRKLKADKIILAGMEWWRELNDEET